MKTISMWITKITQRLWKEGAELIIRQLNLVLRSLLALGLVLTSLSAVAAETVLYVHTDHLGTPIVWTDENGNVVKTREYEPYGYVVNGPIENGPGYTGHVEDAATGLVYMQQRYYDPMVGRFLSVDPVTASPHRPAYFNRYWYAGGNPYKYKDTDGRCFGPAALACIAYGKPIVDAVFVAGTAIAGAVLVEDALGHVMNNDAASGEGGTGTGDLDVDGMSESGSEMDPADKGGTLTKAGRALQKHGGREGSAFPSPSGSPDDINAQGQDALDDILTNPDSTVSKGNRFGDDAVDVRDPSGKGARFDEDGKFRGFLEPPRTEEAT